MSDPPTRLHEGDTYRAVRGEFRILRILPTSVVACYVSDGVIASIPLPINASEVGAEDLVSTLESSRPEALSAEHPYPEFERAALSHLAQWTSPQIAEAIGLTEAELRDLTLHTDLHYRIFEVPKRSGNGVRVIAAPDAQLIRAQRWVLSTVLRPPGNLNEPHSAATGFRDRLSIAANAERHASKAVVIKIDLADFFHSIKVDRVRLLFDKLGYAPEIAALLSRLTTNRAPGSTYRALPQGAPTSPVLSNLTCVDLDVDLTAVAATHDFRYSRYADDLVFSRESSAIGAGRMIHAARITLKKHGFLVNESKTRVM